MRLRRRSLLLILVWMTFLGLLNTQRATGQDEAQLRKLRAEDGSIPLRRPPSIGLTRDSPSQPRNSTGTPGYGAGYWVILICVLACAGLIYQRRRHDHSASIPHDVVQNLGHYSLDQKNTLRLVKCGHKVLILCDSPQFGLRFMAEITDGVEVERITSQCNARPRSAVIRHEVASNSSPSNLLRPHRLSPNSSSSIESSENLAQEEQNV